MSVRLVSRVIGSHSRTHDARYATSAASTDRQIWRGRPFILCSMLGAPKSFVDLIDHVELLLATPADQQAWADSHRVPGEEIALQFYDAFEVFLPYLRERGFIDHADDIALRELYECLRSVQTRLFAKVFVTDAPEWEQVRERAATAAASLRRPLSEKNA
jgi:hypothetical protein